MAFWTRGNWDFSWCKHLDSIWIGQCGRFEADTWSGCWEITIRNLRLKTWSKITVARSHAKKSKQLAQKFCILSKFEEWGQAEKDVYAPREELCHYLSLCLHLIHIIGQCRTRAVPSFHFLKFYSSKLSPITVTIIQAIPFQIQTNAIHHCQPKQHSLPWLHIPRTCWTQRTHHRQWLQAAQLLTAIWHKKHGINC